MSVLRARIPEELIAELEERFPPKRHTTDETHAEIMQYSGKLCIIEYLRSCFEHQKEKILS